MAGYRVSASSGRPRVAWDARVLAALRRAADMLHGETGGEMAADAYLHPNILLRGFFQLRLRMLIALINRLSKTGEITLGEVVDLGGGVGLMCGLLAPYARAVRLTSTSIAAWPAWSCKSSALTM